LHHPTQPSSRRDRKEKKKEILTTTSFPALIFAAILVSFSKNSARFQYAAAKHENANTRLRKITKKTIFVRSEQMRKTRQTSPA
jgi:hypothetical protein